MQKVEEEIQVDEEKRDVHKMQKIRITGSKMSLNL